MIQTSAFLDVQCAHKKAQNYNKIRENAEDLFDTGHFIEEDEFALLVMFVLQEIQLVLKSLKTLGDDDQHSSIRKDGNSIIDDSNGDDEDNDSDNNITLLFRLQTLCFTGIALLDGGLRREIAARLRVDSLIRKEEEQKQQQQQYYLKKQTEKRNRGNTHEVPIFEISACLFQLWKKERKVVGVLG